MPKPINQKHTPKVSVYKNAGWPNDSNELYASLAQLDIFGASLKLYKYR